MTRFVLTICLAVFGFPTTRTRGETPSGPKSNKPEQSPTDTRPGDSDRTRPRGLCAQVNFKDLGGEDTLRWFRMAFDGVEVTGDLTWIVAPETGDRSGGRVCYAPDLGFAPGKHTAAISVADPNNINVPAKQTIGWAFEVSE